MPTTASERAALRATNTFQYDFQPLSILPSILERWQRMHGWTIDVGDDLEVFDPMAADVFECFCTKVLGDSVWIQRHDRHLSELADLACLQPLTDEFGFEEF